MTRYIVLRDRAKVWRRTTGPTAPFIAPAGGSLSGDPVIETADLSPDALRATMTDPDCLAVCPTMPTRLVQPEPVDGMDAQATAPGWGVTAIGADQCPWDGAGCRMAVLDTGVDRQHPAFDGVGFVTRDFVGTGVTDANGHGTHIAGTILGRDLGGVRIGVARGITDLMVAKTLSDSGLGCTGAFMEAFMWAVDQSADIAMFALSFDIAAQVSALVEQGFPLVQANTAAVNAYRGNLRLFELVTLMLPVARRPLTIAAVGNDSLRFIADDFETGPSAPAASERVLAVGAVASDGETFSLAHFSNLSPALVGPGVGITSAALGGESRALNGSSMAAAHVAGAAALWLQQMRNTGETVNANKLANRLIQTAKDSGPCAALSRTERGHGMVQVPQG
ncbi:S8 family serine peptidase [Sagittula sp. SSi028]|uniref:S8 family serine peptidase n=1 Tax=Sagittula sp. SSi028 TaxID=3400636 RepID=UPI003AF8D263